MNNVGKNKCDIASYLYSYLKEEILYAQVLFVNRFIVGFFDKHLQWYKQICPKSNCVGFRAVDMGVNLYLMHCDLEDIQEIWRTKNCMAPFVQTYPATAEYKIDEMVSDFFKIVEHRIKKYLKQWRKRHLPFVLGGDVLPASYISNWLLGLPPPTWMPETYESDTHRATVNVRACGRFLVADERKENHTPKWCFAHA